MRRFAFAAALLAVASSSHAQNKKDAAAPAPIEWVRIEGGTFYMGTNQGPASSGPARKVTVRTFEISKSEVTVAQFAACARLGECHAMVNDRWRCNSIDPERVNHPINCVDWKNAKRYANFVHARLPTEAEWEFAARSRGKDIAYPWGGEPPTCERAVMNDPDAAPHYGCGALVTSPVCSKRAGNTDQGLCDMAGNVSEWVADRYHANYNGAPPDSSSWEFNATEYPVIRGAAFTHDDESGRLKTTSRHYQFDAPLYTVGFRVARDVPAGR
ncbi:MAG: SUMF1/EgtB/PvdO family nonheme iron enzyme [Elusimicrobia bacterium]|nr:SUMF1/EgtB/PvdO family nonheme iron enzyme [Elusimicrobiota bacterium]